MAQKTKKRKAPRYTVDFITALAPAECQTRLARDPAEVPRGVGGPLAPMVQDVLVSEDGSFMVEREFPGALHPIRLVGQLDANESGGGTWVHGAVTFDTANQVTIEGLLAFVTFFVLTVVIFLRLREDALLATVPLLLIALVVLSARWRTLRHAAEDLPRWVRRKLYLTRDQVPGQ